MLQLTKRASDVRIQELNMSQILTAASTAVMVCPIVSKQGSTVPLMFTNADSFIEEYGEPEK